MKDEIPIRREKRELVDPRPPRSGCDLYLLTMKSIYEDLERQLRNYARCPTYHKAIKTSARISPAQHSENSGCLIQPHLDPSPCARPTLSLYAYIHADHCTPVRLRPHAGEQLLAGALLHHTNLNTSKRRPLPTMDFQITRYTQHALKVRPCGDPCHNYHLGPSYREKV